MSGVIRFATSSWVQAAANFLKLRKAILKSMICYQIATREPRTSENGRKKKGPQFVIVQIGRLFKKDFYPFGGEFLVYLS